MPYATIPLDGNFDNPTVYEVRRVANRFTEGQAEDRSRDGLNAVKHTRQIDIYFTGHQRKAVLENFLNSRRGVTPFYYNPHIDKTEVGALYTCKEYSFQRMSEFGGTDDVYHFVATFEQVFRLRS